jgi:hypothetical protein
MDKSLLKQVVVDQRDVFFSKKKLIKRDISLDTYIKTKQVIVISGIRRCGKSSLLYLINKELKLPKSQIIYFNLDDERLIHFKVADFNMLYALHIELYRPTISKLVWFLDEVQNVFGWEKFVNRMHEKGMKLFVTGSNASLLSSEISTSLTGRNMTLELMPFSFKEYLRFKQISYQDSFLTTEQQAILVNAFQSYMHLGGFPQVVQENNKALLEAYYQDIIYRDIVGRYTIQQTSELKNLGLYISSNIGKLHSSRKLLAISGLKSLSTLKNYLSYIEGSYLFYFICKFDYAIKKQLLNPKKIYISDTGFYGRVGYSASEDYGYVLENIVFLALKRSGASVYYHKNKFECDFVIRNNQKISQAIQVTVHMNNERTRNREIRGVTEAMHDYHIDKGYILTEDETDELQIDNKQIIIKPAWKWILDG